jgi:predicted TIM-barrel fold metal-dependent hydrolase
VTVDAYAHCGREKYLPVEALEAVMTEAGVERAVLCQHLGEFDNSYIASLLEARPGRFAGVGLVDHDANGWKQSLAELGRLGFRGLRITSDLLRDRSVLPHEAASVGFDQVIYAPEGVCAIAEPLRALASAHPQVAFVVSHLGNPAVEGGVLRRGDELLRLADLPNLHVLLSGFGMFCLFPYGPLDGLINEVVEAFGPARVMWGSNFPVCGDAAPDYLRELHLVLSGERWGIDADAAAAISDTTARRLWFR